MIFGLWKTARMKRLEEKHRKLDELLKQNREKQERLQILIEKVKATLDGEEEWFLCQQEKEVKIDRTSVTHPTQPDPSPANSCV